MDEIMALLRSLLGLDPDSLGKGALESSIRSRMSELGITDAEQYFTLLQTDENELSTLVGKAIVHETWFYRQAQAFSLIGPYVKERLKTQETVHILSLPCSTGEEAYSIAIELLEAKIPPSPIKIVGVDVGAEALSKAKTAIYRPSSFRCAGEKDITPYFLPVENSAWQLKEEIRQRVTFYEGNVLDLSIWKKAAPWDIVFCRNLLIYLDHPSRQQVITHLREHTRQGALILTGHAETSLFLQDGFKRYGPTSAFAFQKTIPEEITIPVSKDAPARGGRNQPSSANTFSSRRPSFVPSDQIERAPVKLHPGPKDKGSQPSLTYSLEQTLELANKGEHTKALPHIRKIVESEPDNVMARSALGVILFAMGQKKEAAIVLRESLYLDPENEEALVYLSIMEKENGNLQRARMLDNRIQALRSKGGKE